ncbi:MAG: class I SAM-dependent rRNA methyltransferase [Anaerolineae bacterium]
MTESSDAPRVVLKPGKEKPVRNFHPWVFSGAVARVEGDAPDGAVVDVVDSKRTFMARGLLNRRSQIWVRLFSWDPADTLDVEFLRRRIAQAHDYRARTVGRDATAYRVVFSEADGVPGLIVDRYGDVLTLQISTLGLAQRRDMVIEALAAELAPQSIVERVDLDMGAREGLDARPEGVVWGEAPLRVEIVENGLRFAVDLVAGQKTGFYLDQRDNRRLVGALCDGARVLNGFAYTGAFGVYAAASGAAQVVHVDTSAEALDMARQNMALNGFDRPQDEYVVGDMFAVLRAYRERGERFDVIILDPPKFAHTTSQVERAARGYKDINLLAFQLLKPEGVLATFSCSGAVDADLFQKIVFGASADARRFAQIAARLTQAPDHPVLLSFPESAYLKGLICRVL